MPVRIAVALLPDPPGALPPPQTGPAVNAAFLNAVRRERPDLAARLHDCAPPRPYALTPLVDDSGLPPAAGSTTTRFEVGLLADELFAPVYSALSADEPWRIGRTSYHRGAVEVTAMTSYLGLAEAAGSQTSWRFRLLTPTGFGTAKEEGARRQRVFPEPEWIFQSLASRWDAFVEGAGLALPLALPEAVAAHAEVVECDLQLADHLVKAGAPAVRGCVGTVGYRLAEPDGVPAEARRALDALAAFALFAGFGDRTAVGMGYVVAAPSGHARDRAARRNRTRRY